MSQETKGTDIAPDGQIWICQACGKRSKSQFGFDAAGKRTNLDHGWDESCMMNSVLVYEKKREGRYWPVVELEK